MVGVLTKLTVHTAYQKELNYILIVSTALPQSNPIHFQDSEMSNYTPRHMPDEASNLKSECRSVASNQDETFAVQHTK